MKSNYWLRACSLLILLVSLFPLQGAGAAGASAPPPVDMFQLPWDQGIAWYAIDGIDNGTKRPASSSHNHHFGGAIDFAPRTNMTTGENTSNFWVTAAADGTVVATATCYVTLAHADGWITQYQFLGNIQVRLGDAVTRNQRIGVIADGVRYPYCPGFQEINIPHLHFMLRPSTIGASFAGWEVKYNSLFNSTTFTKDGNTVGLFRLLMNVMGSATTPTSTAQTPVGTPGTGTPGTSLPTSVTPTGTPATPTPTSQIPSDTPTFVASPTPTVSGPYVSTTITPQTIDLGGTALVTVRLNNVPPEGYSSAEFTCSYNANLFTVSNIAVASLFGPDPVSAINGPNPQNLLVAIAGSNGNKATTSGTAFTFNVTGAQIGQTVIECRARVSQGNSVLTEIPFVVDFLTIQGDTPTPNLTPSVTPTLVPTSTPTSDSPSPALCDQAAFVADVTVPPGTQFFPGTQFTKTWRLQNVGTCTWTTAYQLVFFSGEQMGAVAAANFPLSVQPGQMVDFSINMTAPSLPGSYRGDWMFKNGNGTLFGTGPQATEPWFVDINVVDSTATPLPTFTPSFTPGVPTETPGGPSPTTSPGITPGVPTATPVTGVAMDFAANACSAVWTSGAGQLPCPGTDGDVRGFVLLPSNPRLETGATDTRPALLTHPQIVQDGYIQGRYPPFHVQAGDRFRTTIGCEFNATDCYVTYRLDYQVGSNPVQTFWGPFLERYEGQTYSVDVDLSSLAGQDVSFILHVLASGSASGDRALWVNPIIQRASISTPVPTEAPGGDWLTFINSTYGFMFGYPPTSQIMAGGTDNYTRIDLAFAGGTNLREKYLEVIVAEDFSACQSPLATSSILETSENVVISGIPFLKQTGSEGVSGGMYRWVAYSTSRGNACVSLDFILRSVNATTPQPPLQEYDYAGESLVFGQMVSTYSWLALAPTSTPTPGATATPTGSPAPTAINTLESPTPAPAEHGIVQGVVLAPKRTIVLVTNAENTTARQILVNPDGTFSFSIDPGTYKLEAILAGYLWAEGSFTVTAGNTVVAPTVTLLAGDIDGNRVIDPFDAMTIGMSYNSATPAEADLNADGVINVLDLELLARNYRATGPTAWE